MNLLKRIFIKIFDNHVFDLAAQLAFYFLMMLFPFMLFCITLLGYFPIDTSEVVDIATKYVPGEMSGVIEKNISNVLNVERNGLLSFGILVAILATSNSIHATIRALNRAYGVKEDRNFFKVRLMSIWFAILFILAILIQLLLPIFGSVIGKYAFSFVGLSEEFIFVWDSVRWLISYLLVTIVITTIYKFGPNIEVKFREVMLGSFFATVGWHLSSLGFSYYVNNFGTFSMMHGSVASFIVLMTWFYLLGFVLLVGGVINATILKQKQS